MEYCKKCGKEVPKNERNPRGLCFNCFREYLLEKVENHYKELKKPIVYKEKKSKKWITFLKNLFKRKKK